VAAAVSRLPGIGVLDRAAVQRDADRDPYWRGVRTGLLTAVVAVIVLALVGYLVDVWIGLRRRAGEYRVLRTLGAPGSAVARSIVLENMLVGGAGALAGLLAGLLASAVTVPLVIRTPEATRPVPAPALVLPWAPILAIALALPVVIVAASWILARGRRS
jgi:predicted lysophospholipase L1 biosynthesis ABC-type transport system permease subunit